MPASTHTASDAPGPPPGKLLYTVAEAAELLAVSRTVLYSLMTRGDLPFVLIGRSRRLPLDGLHRFVEREALRQGFPGLGACRGQVFGWSETRTGSAEAQ